MDYTAAAYGVYCDAPEVMEVVRVLNDAGFEKEQVCLILAPTHPVSTIVRDAYLLNQEREASTVTAGLIGWLSELGADVIPSVGFFIRWHAFLRALPVARSAPHCVVTPARWPDWVPPRTTRCAGKRNCSAQDSWFTWPRWRPRE